MERTPHSEGGGGSVSIPHIEVRRFELEDVRLGAQLAGRAATLSLRGGLDLRSLEDARADVTARRIDGDGEYTMHLRFDAQRMDGTLAVHEPASGPLENILKVPGLGALSANLAINGPREAEHVDLKLTAGGLSAAVGGSVDLRRGSMDLDYSLEAPAVSPRPDLKWQTNCSHGPVARHPQGSDRRRTSAGRTDSSCRADLRLPRCARIFRRSRGAISACEGVVEGLRIPGPQASLFEKDPLKI